MKVKVSVKLLPNGQGKADKEKELTKNVDFPNINKDDETIRLEDILKNWDEKTRRDYFDNRIVSYWSKLNQAFVNIGNYWLERPNHAHKDIPDAKYTMLKMNDIIQDDIIQIKLRERAKGEHSDALINGQAELSKGSRRTKERKIGEVILAVKKWRELYTVGEKQPEGGFKTLSLEDAALKVGISKKSLDDYFLQLK